MFISKKISYKIGKIFLRLLLYCLFLNTFMKKCLVCNKELEKDESEICHTCFEFLKWKHKKKYLAKIREFRKLENKDSGSIKFRRKK